MILTRFLTIYVVEDLIQRGFEKESIWQILTNARHLFARYFHTVILAPMIFIPIKLLKTSLEEKGKIEALEKEKVSAQLKFLKTQIHPHFLFNTLNNLYLLTLEKREEAPEVVLKLSEMLDYMLYQCNVPLVSISKEIALIENYMDLEKLRYDERLGLTFESSLEKQNARIAPLLLLTLVENAFKHGGEGQDGKTHIKIKVTEMEDELNMQVYNTKSNVGNRQQKKGIGLENLKTQLELQYPNKHNLLINETPESYEVALKISLL